MLIEEGVEMEGGGSGGEVFRTDRVGLEGLYEKVWGWRLG